MSAASLDPSPARRERLSLMRPAPLTTLMASAQRLTQQKLERRSGIPRQSQWQEDAWDMYDLVGEERFLATTLANRVAQARLYVGRLAENPTDPPEPVDDPRLQGILDAIGDSPVARMQLVQRLAVNLFVAGDGWLCGIPRHLIPLTLRNQTSLEVQEIEPLPDQGLVVDDLEWRMLSVSEVSSSAGQITLKFGESVEEWVNCSPDDVFLVRVWRPHPRRAWEADSPTRASLPVLRELVGLTMHISAQVDSRLAGAGLLVIPQSAQRAMNLAAGLDEETAATTDSFTEALLEAMTVPISDRASASALVPLVVTVPDEAAGLFNYMTFAKPLDTESRPLRDEAIRRLALGQDAPPELLLGMSGMNHWGAWLVREDVVTTHIEPPLALICDALTTQYLWPVLEENTSPVESPTQTERVHDLVIWYDVSHMVMRPNQADDAKELHSRGVLSDDALLDATGFSDQDKSAMAQQPVEVAMALELVKSSPGLMSSPGLPAVVAQIRAALNGDIPDLTLPTAAQPPATEPAPPAAEPTAPATEPATQPAAEPGPPATPGAQEQPAPALTAAAITTTDLLTEVIAPAMARRMTQP